MNTSINIKGFNNFNSSDWERFTEAETFGKGQSPLIHHVDTGTETKKYTIVIDGFGAKHTDCRITVVQHKSENATEANLLVANDSTLQFMVNIIATAGDFESAASTIMVCGGSIH